MKPVLSGSMIFPRGAVDEASVKKALTIKYRPLGEDEPVVVCAFKVAKDGLHVPRQYGIQLCAKLGLDYEDRTSAGFEIDYKTNPKPRDYQIEPLRQIGQCFKSHYDFIFRARTGWGKTIGSLLAATKLGTTVGVLVDQENLKDQWVEALTKHFGFAKEDIGIVQGNKSTFAGKAVTIMMVQTLARRGIPKELADYFGVLIVDEVHIIGAPTFAKVLLEFSASYRFGVSATPKRRDALQKLIEYNLGEVRLWVEDEHAQSAVYIATHPTIYSQYANASPKMGTFITEVADDGSRNLLIAESALYLYDTGRDTLVLSDRTEQLSDLANLYYYLGLDDSEVGVYAVNRLEYAYEKDPTPLRRPYGYERGTEFTPVRLSLISKKQRKDRLEAIKESAGIILATFGKFSKGVDVPRLRGGVDATPRSRAEQMQGRILRNKQGRKAIWITIADTRSYRSMFALLARIPEYLKNNSVISRWSLSKGKTKCEVNDLKEEVQGEIDRLRSMQIVTNAEGLNTLLTKQQQIRSELQRVSVTMRTASRRRDSRMVS